MKQITDTVNSFVAFIVAVGLICLASFVFLLASARLSNSTLGALLAQSAGETARMARTESLAFWGQVGGEVAVGLGYGRQPLSTSGGGSPIVTPVVIVATQPPAPQGGGAPQATATPIPAAFIRSSPVSEGGLLLWRGLDANSQRLPLGVNLEQVLQQASFALSQNSGDLLALWLMKVVNNCRPLYDQMVQANYQDPTQADIVRNAADAIIAQCNPRLFAAYANKRWAELAKWTSQVPIDESQAASLLNGLQITIDGKIDGPARANRPEDHVQVTVQAVPEFGLTSRTFVLTVATINQLLGADNWTIGGGPYPVGSGRLYPDNPPEPALPTDADLTPPVVPPGGGQARSGPSAPVTAGGKYIVQSGDTVYSIARKLNVSPEALIAANANTLGFNPNFITPGQELIVPSSP